MFEKLGTQSYTPYILPLGIRHRYRTRPGIQYCPSCLADDVQPYFRRQWRLACVTLCTRHRRLLDDVCWSCHAPLNFHRGEMGNRQRVHAAPICTCNMCHADLRSAPSIPIPEDVLDFLTQFQCSLEDAIRDGWIRGPDRRPIYSHLFFQGFRTLIRAVCTSHKRNSMSWLLAERFPWGTGLPFEPRRHNFERERISVRAKAVYWAARLLENWPDRFVNWSDSTTAGSSEFTRDVSCLPYWVHSVVRKYIYNGCKLSSIDARSALRRLWAGRRMRGRTLR